MRLMHRKKNRRNGSCKRTAVLGTAVLLFLSACGRTAPAAGGNRAGTAEPAAEQTAEQAEQTEMDVYFLDVGQGDCTLVRNGEHAMLIDAGDNEKEVLVLEYLISLDVDRLDYLVLTHTDADHIGGADAVLTHFPVGTVLMGDYPRENDTYRDVLDALEGQGLSFATPSAGSSYSLGDAEFTVVGPSRSYEEVNNTSISLRLEKGENSFLFTGDAEREAEWDMTRGGEELSADVYQVGHHGSHTSSTEAFLDAVDPDYAVISCGAGNDYGYPHEETLEHLWERGVTVYRTDEQSSILAACDGQEIRFRSLPGLERLYGSVTYVCNIHTKKFHLPGCENAAQIAEHNRMEVDLSREEVLEMGYAPCGGCRP